MYSILKKKESKLSGKVQKTSPKMTKIKQEPSFEEIFDKYFGDIPTGPSNQVNDQEVIAIDSEVSDDEDCILVTFNCDKCPESFNTNRSLKKHKKKHNWKFVCEACNIKFRTENKLQNHKESSHNHPARFACAPCKKKFSKEIALNDHKRDYHDFPGRFPCLECGKKFNTKQAFENHQQSKNQRPKTYKCQFCNDEIEGNKAFKKHKKSHTTIKMEPKIELKTELMDVKEEPRIFSFGTVKIEMDS